jgi:hypothetical protein
MFQEDLKKFVEENPKLVKIRTAGEGIYVLKYSKKVFYDNLWNDYLEECRGTIVDINFNVISRPFTKIYNYGIEAKAPRLAANTPISAYRKINGFMVAVTLHNDELLVSTTGTTDSDYVKMAKEFINTERYLKVCREWPDTTFMFECVHPNDPHIIPEQPGLYLLGYRVKSWVSECCPSHQVLDMMAKDFDCFAAEFHRTTLGALRETIKTVQHEGFVFYTDDGVASKIKSPFYLFSKFVARNPNTEKLMKPGVKQMIDEEYYPLIDAIQEDIEEFTVLSEQERLAWVRNFLEKQ